VLLGQSSNRKLLHCEKLVSKRDVVTVKFNVKNSPLLNTEKVLLPPLHIKLGVVKKFLKALDKGGEDFLYLRIKFPNRGDDKVEQDIFVGSQIGNIMLDENFERSF
jgi:hypothetical protein